jgi:CxxC-x17-CxxC domain-containing protein
MECADCGGTFVFTAGEQAFYQERSFSDPKRCPQCRQARKANRAGGGSSSRGGDFGGGYGGGSRGGYRDRPPRKMYDVICDDCGEPTQVPFEPRGDRPVYCKDCYQNRRSW